MLRMAPRVRGAGGFTLLELMVVLVILGAVAALARLASDPVRPAQLEAAARDVVQALRFAQADAIRSGAYRVVDCSVTTNTIRIYALNMVPKPPIEDTVTPIKHPVDKKLYLLALAARAGTGMVQLDSCQFVFSGGPTISRVAFGSDGAPVYVGGPVSTDIKPLASGVLQVSAGTHRRTISVDPRTGRITVSS
jgi:prepilin-type N-terminal cleavage/methylation domain-containing protein